MPPPAARAPRPGDATLSVTKAARVLGVHPNTVRAWSDAGRLRYYRINERGDRRYRPADLQRFLAAAASGAPAQEPTQAGSRPVRHGATAAPMLTDMPAGLDLLADLTEIASFPSGLDPALDQACRQIRQATGAALVGIWERRPGGLVPRAIDAEGGRVAARTMAPSRGLFSLALDSPSPIHARPGLPGPAPVLGLGTDELVVRIPGGENPWGLLVLAGAMQLGHDDGRRLAGAIARTLGVLIRGATAAEQAAARLRQSEALRRVATDLASRLDVGDVVRDLGDHARVLFGADRVAVVLRDPEGRISSPGGVGFSARFLELALGLEEARVRQQDIPPRRPEILLGADARRVGSSAVRAAAIQEGVETLVVLPLVDGHDLLGMLYLAHDRVHRWREVDLEAAEALAGDASTAVRSARTFSRMAAWAAQLQSIQRLGARLSGLSEVGAIGHAIATELRQLIDYENVRVYRVRGQDLVPVAMLGHGAVYSDETVEKLTVAVGEGITGWVARFRVPQLVDDTANDPRAITIPGTPPDADESMLLAPMVQEGACLGVVVLSRQGLRQFTEDDLRLLVIYASFAGQAMANADATAQLREQSSALERRLRAQRELLRVTESILTTLDQREVLEGITDSLGTLIQCDNIAIEAVERPTGLLVPLTARGIHADDYLAPWEPGETGIATWVVDHNEPVLIEDERTDPRVNHFRSIGQIDGSLIVVPLLGPSGAAGVMTLERLGTAARFDEEEFELVKLFAAQVSIALRNAEIFHAAEVRARTDTLTGLLNHGTFEDWLSRSVAAREPFGLVIIDLDEFRDINNALGHQAGDRLLREIAIALLGAARDTDAVFRYGGDEFVVILPNAELESAAAAAARALERLHGLAAPDAAGSGVSASIGVAQWQAPMGTDELLEACDAALMRSKRQGKGRVTRAAEPVR